MIPKISLSMLALCLLALLGACDRENPARTAGQPNDDVVAKAEQRADEGKGAATNPAERLGDKTNDASITAAVKDRLARDEYVRSLEIIS